MNLKYEGCLLPLLQWRLSANIKQTVASAISPGLNANEIQIPCDQHHKVSSLVKSHQNTHNSVKYEVK